MQFPWYVHYSMVSPLESDTDGTLECVQYYNELPNAESPFHTGVETDDMEQYFSSVKKLFKKYNKDYLTITLNVYDDNEKTGLYYTVEDLFTKKYWSKRLSEKKREIIKIFKDHQMEIAELSDFDNRYGSIPIVRLVDIGQSVLDLI